MIKPESCGPRKVRNPRKALLVDRLRGWAVFSTDDRRPAGKDSTMNGTAARTLWFAFVILAGVFVGAAGGLLSFAGGARAANAVLAGGGSFVTATTLGLLMVAFLHDRK
jgi:hypothetical protein